MLAKAVAGEANVPFFSMSGSEFVADNFVYWFTMIVNIIGLVLGIVMIFSPNISIAAVAYIVGAYLVLFGIDCIILAFSRIGEGKQY